MKNYVQANISLKSNTTVKYAMKMLSSSSETIIFMFLGVSTINDNHNANVTFILITIFFCTFYRIIGKYIFFNKYFHECPCFIALVGGGLLKRGAHPLANNITSRYPL